MTSLPNIFGMHNSGFAIANINLRSIIVLACISLVGTEAAVAGPNELPAPAAHRPTFTDGAMVDIESRSTHFSIPDVKIGSGDAELAHVAISNGSRFSSSSPADNFLGGLSQGVGASSNGGGCPNLVGTSTESDCFTSYTGSYQSLKQNGATLINVGGGILNYTNSDGDIYSINTNIYGNNNAASAGILTNIKRTNGNILTFTWQIYPLGKFNFARLISVSNSFGYALKYEYGSDQSTNNDIYTGFGTLTKVTAYNRAVDNCPLSALHCTFSRSWPSATYQRTSLGQFVGYNLQIQDAGGATSSFRLDPTERVVGYRPSNASVERYTWTYCRAVTNGVPSPYLTNYGDPCTITYSNGSTNVITDGVKWAIKDGRQWNYNPRLTLGGCGCYYYNISTDPDGRTSSISTFTNATEPEVITYSNVTEGRDYTFSQTDSNHLLTAKFSDEATWGYSYDSRNNVIEARQTATAGSGDTDIVRSATYSTTCSNPLICNKPNSITDARGNVTQIYYDSNSGLAMTITYPMVNGISPQTRFTYIKRYATYIDDNGNLASSPDGVWLLATKSECRTSSWAGSACSAGVSDESVIQYDYGPLSGPNNLLLRDKTILADGSALRTCYGYDVNGNRTYETKPRANLSSCY